jgi:hypothetical protein
VHCVSCFLLYVCGCYSHNLLLEFQTKNIYEYSCAENWHAEVFLHVTRLIWTCFFRFIRKIRPVLLQVCCLLTSNNGWTIWQVLKKLNVHVLNTRYPCELPLVATFRYWNTFSLHPQYCWVGLILLFRWNYVFLTMLNINSTWMNCCLNLNSSFQSKWNFICIK